MNKGKEINKQLNSLYLLITQYINEHEKEDKGEGIEIPLKEEGLIYFEKEINNGKNK